MNQENTQQNTTQINYSSALKMIMGGTILYFCVIVLFAQIFLTAL